VESNILTFISWEYIAKALYLVIVFNNIDMINHLFISKKRLIILVREIHSCGCDNFSLQIIRLHAYLFKHKSL